MSAIPVAAEGESVTGNVDVEASSDVKGNTLDIVWEVNTPVERSLDTEMDTSVLYSIAAEIPVTVGLRVTGNVFVESCIDETETWSTVDCEANNPFELSVATESVTTVLSSNVAETPVIAGKRLCVTGIATVEVSIAEIENRSAVVSEVNNPVEISGATDSGTTVLCSTVSELPVAEEGEYVTGIVTVEASTTVEGNSLDTSCVVDTPVERS